MFSSFSVDNTVATRDINPRSVPESLNIELGLKPVLGKCRQHQLTLRHKSVTSRVTHSRENSSAVPCDDNNILICFMLLRTIHKRNLLSNTQQKVIFTAG
jgi:hypothetical protein